MDEDEIIQLRMRCAEASAQRWSGVTMGAATVSGTAQELLDFVMKPITDRETAQKAEADRKKAEQEAKQAERKTQQAA